MDSVDFGEVFAFTAVDIFSKDVTLLGKGQCNFKATFNGETQTSQKFDITDSLKGNMFLNKKSFKLGEVLQIDGDVLYLDNSKVNGVGIFSLLQKDSSEIYLADTFNVEDGSLLFESSLENLPPGSYDVIVESYDSYGNENRFNLGAIDISEKELANFQGQIKNITDLKDKVTQISTTRILEVLIAGALKIGASDIHFEPERESARLRYRMDGVLADVTKLKNEDYLKIVSRIKVLSKLKLNVHAAAQDGRFTIRQESVAIEVRVSILPSEYGETIVMRLLDPRKIKQNLDELGIREDLLALIKEQLSRANGALLTTGPTGSGKTTSLYAFINYLNTADTKIITIEDPIEYHIAGISQTQVDPAKDYTFANGLRAIVRQDPDIILVGEIRDTETAEIALNAALTGHIVLSTIHTNDAAGTIPRLIDLGVPSQTIAPAVNMAMAQRLVRRLCVKCRQEITVTAELYEKIVAQLGPIKDKLDIQGISPTMKVSFPGKCAECNETGYKGRVGVYEAFIVSREIEKMILGNPSTSDIQDQAIKDGMTTMLQDAYMKLVAGITSIEEIERIL